MKKIINLDKKKLTCLPAGQFAARLMAIPAKEGLDLLLDRPDAEEVVKAMPEQDFYLFVKEVGSENATSVLGLARIEQLNHLLDLECWTRDQVKAGKTLEWLETILMASNQKFLEWLYKVDFELLVLLFKRWLDVQMLPEDTEYCEVDESFPQNTIDDQFYYSVKYPQYTELLKSVLSFLFETHNQFYRELMQHIISAMDTEVEELAYRFHRGRLADNAVPDFEEAVSIYRPISPSALNKKKYIPPDDYEGAPAPFFAMMPVSKHTLLTEALARIDNPAVRTTLQTEFAALANKIIVADALSPDIPDNLKNSADKATACVNLALEKLSNGDPGQASSLLQRVAIEDLFRLAQANVREACLPLQKAINSGWISQWPYGLNILDQEWYEAASLLQAKTPMILRTDQFGGKAKEDLIRTRADLDKALRVSQMLDNLSALYLSLQTGQEKTWTEIASRLWHKAQHHGLDSITLGTLVITSAVNTIWWQKWSPTPLPLNQWPNISVLLDFDKVKNTISEQCSLLFPDESSISSFQEYMEPVLNNHKEDMEVERNGSVTSPHLIPYLLFSDE